MTAVQAQQPVSFEVADTYNMDTDPKKKKKIDKFIPRKPGAETDKAIIQKKLDSIKSAVDGAISSEETYSAKLCYANEYVDYIPSQFEVYCQKLIDAQKESNAQKRELTAKDPRGGDLATGFVLDAPLVKQKQEFPELLKRSQELSCRIHFLDQEIESVLSLYRAPQFRAMYAACRKIQEECGTLTENAKTAVEMASKLQTLKQQFSSLKLTVSAKDTILFALYRTRIDTLNAMLTAASKQWSITPTQLTLLRNAISEERDKEVQSLAQLPVSAAIPGAKIVSDTDLDAFVGKTTADKERNIDPLFGSWQSGTSWKTWAAKDFYKKVQETAAEVKKEVQIACALMREIKMRTVALASGIVTPRVGKQNLQEECDYYTNILHTLRTKVAASVEKLFKGSSDTVVPKVGLFTTGLERDVAIIFDHLAILREFCQAEFGLVADAQSAFSLHLAEDDSTSLKAIETLFTAAKKIWEQEKACLKELKGQVADSYVGRHMEMTIRMLHEAVSRKGPQILKPCDADARAWDDITGHSRINGLPEHVQAYIERLATNALYFTKKRSVELEIMLHILGTPPYKPHFDAASETLKEIVADYEKFLDKDALGVDALAVAHSVVNWSYHASRKERDPLSYARAWSQIQPFLDAKSKDLTELTTFLLEELDKVAQEQGYCVVDETIRKKSFNQVRDPYGLHDTELSGLLVRAVGLAIWGKDLQQKQAQALITRVIQSEKFAACWEKMGPDLQRLLYENAMAKIRSGQLNELTQTELDLLEKGPFAEYLNHSQHSIDDDQIGDVLFKLVHLEATKQDKHFSELCRNSMGERQFITWFEAKKATLVGWKLLA